MIIAIPLILRKVPRNVIYGFHIKATLENDFVWYKVNAYFGKRLDMTLKMLKAVSV